MTPPPLIAHIVHRLAMGGLENGLVNLVNHMPVERYRHAVISLTDYTAFRERIRRPDVEVFALEKRAGKDFAAYGRLWALLRRLRPQIVHTRNFGTLDCLGPARLAGVRHLVHGEHGRDMIDLHGENRKQLWLRRLHAPLVSTFVPMSVDLADWLAERVGVDRSRIRQIYNGVDIERFVPGRRGREDLAESGIAGRDKFVIGSVGRMSPVKDQLTMVRAFLLALDQVPDARARLRLVHAGDGPLHAQARALVEAHGAGALAWLPGARDDVPDVLRSLDVFVLPSLAEGISNTILEAMGCGLPVVATRVGGNAELVADGTTGRLVPPADPAAMARALVELATSPETVTRMGRAARDRAVRRFGLPAMVDAYVGVYDAVLHVEARGGR